MDYINKTELATISNKELENEKLEFLFAGKYMRKSSGTIFVIDDEERFLGIITVGDYKRYKKNGVGLVNETCKRVFTDGHEMECATKIHESYPKIKIIPVLEEDTGVLKGGIQLFESRNTFYYDATNIFETYRDYFEIYCKDICCDEITVYGNDILILSHTLSLLKKLDFIENVYPVVQDEVVAKEIFDTLGYKCVSKSEHNTKMNICLDENCYIENGITLGELSEKVWINCDQREKKSKKKDGNSLYAITHLESLEKKYGILVKFVGIPNIEDLKINTNTLVNVSEAEIVRKPLSDFAKKFLNDEILADDIMNIVRVRWKDLYVTNCDGEHLTIRNGKRMLPNANYGARKRVYLVGPCVVEGRYVNNQSSVGYLLQKKLEERGYEVCVRSASIEWGNYKKWLGHIKVKKGDMILIIDRWHRLQRIDLDMSKRFQEAYDNHGQFFTDSPIHCNYIGHKYLAEEIYQAFFNEETDNLEDSVVLRNYMSELRKEGDDEVFPNNPELEEYKKFLLSIKTNYKGKIGAIVMNCNPFTLGHRYLIECALKKVDFLYIFVVQEERSRFPFEDRIRLVKEGTKDLNRICVIPSGKFIISTDTFSEYFTKGMATTANIDTSLDVETFAQHIAPILDIKVRFVGEEPIDAVTLQYNQDMLEILPDYGIQVDVIARKQVGDEVISASRVRKLLNEHNWEDIKKLVPECTYQYLYDGVNY